MKSRNSEAAAAAAAAETVGGAAEMLIFFIAELTTRTSSQKSCFVGCFFLNLDLIDLDPFGKNIASHVSFFFFT